MGAASIRLADRPLPLSGEVVASSRRRDGAGWYRVEVAGRAAEAPDELTQLPSVRGHLWGRRLVREGGVAEELHLLPAALPRALTGCTARSWHGGELLLEREYFESGAARGCGRTSRTGR